MPKRGVLLGRGTMTVVVVIVLSMMRWCCVLFITTAILFGNGSSVTTREGSDARKRNVTGTRRQEESIASRQRNRHQQTRKGNWQNKARRWIVDVILPSSFKLAHRLSTVLRHRTCIPSLCNEGWTRAMTPNPKRRRASYYKCNNKNCYICSEKTWEKARKLDASRRLLFKSQNLFGTRLCFFQ